MAYFNVVLLEFLLGYWMLTPRFTPSTYRIQIKRFPVLTSLEKWMTIESGYFHYGFIDDDSSSMITCFVLIKITASILYVHCKF